MLSVFVGIVYGRDFSEPARQLAVEERIFSYLIEPRRVANMVALVPGEFGFVLRRSDRRKTAPADGVVGAIGVDSVGKGGCPIHEAPLFKTKLESLYRLLISTPRNLVKIGHMSRLSLAARMRSVSGAAFPVQRLFIAKRNFELAFAQELFVEHALRSPLFEPIMQDIRK
jgi:hypothetical protein